MNRRGFHIQRDLGLQLLAFYLLLIIPFIAFLIEFDNIVGVRIQRDTKSNDLALAHAIAFETDSSLSSSLTAVKNLADYPSVIAIDKLAMAEIFKVVLQTRPEVNLVYRLNADGVMTYHYPTGPTSTVGTNFSYRDYYQNSLTAAGPIISQGRISPTTNQAVATAVMPLHAMDGSYSGLVGTNIKLESLSATLSAIVAEHQSSEGFEVMILDSSAQIIAHPNPAYLLKPAQEILPNIYENALNGETGSVVTADLNGTERLYTYATIPTLGWGVFISRPTSSAFATQITLERITQISAATFILIGLAFWGLLSIRVIRPIEKLAPITQAIGMNQPIADQERNQIRSMSNRADQIGDLIRSFLRMEDSINTRMKEQATLLETSAVVVSSLELNTVLNRILEQAGRLLEVQKTAIIALDEKRGEFRIRASRGLSKSFTEQLSLKPGEPASVSMRALRAKEPIQVSDTESDPAYEPERPRARAEGYRSVLGVPLNTQHAPPTVLLVFRPEPHLFTPNEINLIVNFANQATMAIENAILFERSDTRLQEQTSRLEALVESMEDGLILSNPQGKVIYANHHITDIADLSDEDMSDIEVARVMNRILDKSIEKEIVDLNAILAGTAQKGELSLTHLGRDLQIRVESFEVTDNQRVLLGRGLLLHDITIDREVDRLKSNLISTVSHELRTPLASIKGYASTLLADDVEWDSKSQKEFLTIISDETDRLTNLVNNLLDLSRIEAGSIRLSLEKCDVRDVAMKAARQAQLSKCEIHLGAEAEFVDADRMRLETILRNLFENAIKYGGAEVKVEMRANHERDSIIFYVMDNGPGIPTEQSEKIFERFYRLDEGLARATSGAGLGLAICQGLVRAHNGEIWVDQLGSGACIAFSIPLIPNE
jgi:signal transduction histidine kinase/HAMP domain-containing protein